MRLLALLLLALVSIRPAQTPGPAINPRSCPILMMRIQGWGSRIHRITRSVAIRRLADSIIYTVGPICEAPHEMGLPPAPRKSP